jgi:hypothetical protein
MALWGADFKAGVSAIDITPSEPIYMSGYASRNHASVGVEVPLHAKALAIQDSRGRKAVVVTTDIIGLPRSLSDLVAARVLKSYGLERAQLVLNSSHTHTGPLIARNLEIMFELKPDERAVVDRYAAKLTEDLVALVGAALGAMRPADLWLGHGAASFTMNRREPTAKGMRIGVNPQGPTDPDVPVLRVTDKDGRTFAVVFGYACHNTTLGGDFYHITGDYSGYAQMAVEKAHAGVTAMFLELCGADQNPNPRGKLELARQHGETLGAEVTRVLGGRLERVRGPVRSAFQVVDLAFAPHTRETFEERLKDKNVWRVRHAKAMLATYQEGRPITRYSYPVQAVTIGKDFALIALGGEVVVDYALRAKKEFGARGLVVAGYSNDVMAYIPSARLLQEGGYEVDDSMIYYGQPGRWADDVEERIFRALHTVMKRVGR